MELSVLNAIGLLLLVTNILVIERMKNREKANVLGLVFNGALVGMYVGGLIMYLMMK
jgi:hypothetical protein